MPQDLGQSQIQMKPASAWRSGLVHRSTSAVAVTGVSGSRQLVQMGPSPAGVDSAADLNWQRLGASLLACKNSRPGVPPQIMEAHGPEIVYLSGKVAELETV